MEGWRTVNRIRGGVIDGGREGNTEGGRRPLQCCYGFLCVNRIPCHVSPVLRAEIFQIYNPSSAAVMTINAASRRRDLIKTVSAV